MCNVLNKKEGFIKANSNNFPLMTDCMVTEYIISDGRFSSSEMAGWKLHFRCAKPNYGDAAVSYVQVKEHQNVFTVSAHITPEHCVRSKPYKVEVNIDVLHHKVMSASCFNCAASRGGCKHAMTFLYWLHRRSEEPSPTEVKCYWKKSSLSLVGSQDKYVLSKEIGFANKTVTRKRAVFDRGIPRSFLKLVTENGIANNTPSILNKYYNNEDELDILDMHLLMCSFKVIYYAEYSFKILCLFFGNFK